MFRTLIYPSSGAYDYFVELAHWSCVLGSMCVGVSVWLVWRGIRVAGFSLVERGLAIHRPPLSADVRMFGVMSLFPLCTSMVSYKRTIYAI